MRILIRQGRVIMPERKRAVVADIVIAGGQVQRIAKKLNIRDADRVIDAREYLVFPGFIDLHTHLREPGYEYKETIASGSRAAVAGGFTAVCAMPNTAPPVDNRTVVDFIHAQSRQVGLTRVHVIGALTCGRGGEKLAELGEMHAAGVVGFSDDGSGVASAEVLRRAMEYAAMLSVPVFSHCEDASLAGAGVMNEGYTATILGLAGIPEIAETCMVARDIELARYTGCHVHICHVSCAESVEMIRRAKKNNVPVTAEVCPHHFTLTEEAVVGYNTSTKVNPPLRSRRDVEALKRGLRDGTIDCIATDHAPHAAVEKDVEYSAAPFGMVGLETCVGLVFSELVNPGILTLPQVAQKLSANPARIIRREGGVIAEGSRADLTLIAPDRAREVKPECFYSLSANTPFAGRRLPATVVYTMVGGTIVYEASGDAAV